MRRTVFILSILLAANAWAGLIGSSVTGFISFGGGTTNYYDPANGFVPAGYLNSTFGPTVTIAEPAVEFGFQDSSNTDTANFTDATLTFTDVPSALSSNSPITLRFTSSAFTSLSLVSNNFPGLTYSLVGNTINIDIPSWSASGSYTAIFDVGSAAIPEPSSFSLLAFAIAAAIPLYTRLKRAQ